MSGWRTKTAQEGVRESLLRQATEVAESLDLSMVAQLTFTAADLESPAFRRLRKQLVAYAQVAHLQNIYALKPRHKEVVFGPEVLDPRDTRSSPPGTPYRRPLPDLKKLMVEGSPQVVGPIQDRRGTILSAFSAVMEPGSGEVLMLVGLDTAAEEWQSVKGLGLPAWVWATVMGGLGLLGLSIRQWRDSLPEEVRLRPGLHHLETGLTAGLCLVLAFAAFVWVRNAGDRRLNRDFQRLCQAKARALRDALDSWQEDLTGIARFCGSLSPVRQAPFQDFVAPITQKSAMACFEWIQRVPRTQKEEFERRARADSLPDYTVRVWRSGASTDKVTYGPDLFPVRCVTPLKGNEAAIGLDLRSEPIRRAALEEAWKSGLPTATLPLTLVQERGQQKGVLVFCPVPSRTGPEPDPAVGANPQAPRVSDQPLNRADESRWPAVEGFALGVLRMQATFDRVLLRHRPHGDDLWIDLMDCGDGAEPCLLASSQPEGSLYRGAILELTSAPQHHLQGTFPVLVFGRTWTLVIRPGPGFFDAHPHREATIAGAAGVLLSLMATGLVGLVRQQRLTLEWAVVERTRQLEDSERKFATSFMSNPEMMFISTLKEGRFLEVNDSVLTVLGYRREELLGRTSIEVGIWASPEDRAEIVNRLQQQGPLVQVPTSLRNKTGAMVHVTVSGQVMAFHGQACLFASIADITRRKALERALQTMSRAVERTSSSIVITNKAGVIEYVNPRFTATSGYVPQEVIGRTPSILKSGETPAEDYRRLWATIAAGREWHGEFHNRRKDGSLYWELTSIAPIFDETGQVIQYVAVKEEITLRKAMEEQLREKVSLLTEKNEELRVTHAQLRDVNDQLEARVQARTFEVERLLRQKDDFIHLLGHDLRTPLTPLSALLPLLLEEEADAERREMLRICRDNSEYMRNLVARTLELCRLGAPRLADEPERTPLKPTVSGVFQMLRSMADGAGCLLMDETPSDLVLGIDRLQLEQLLVNLLENAIKFSPEGGEVRVRAFVEKDQATLTVEDQGVGLDADHASRAFDEFFKADSSRHDRHSAGLGLCICRRIVEQHAGQIRLESPGLGHGTLVRVTLPLATPDLIVDLAS